MRGMMPHAKLPRDQKRNPWCGPYLPDKVVRFRSLRQQRYQPRALLVSELRFRPGWAAMAQGLPTAALPRPREPLTDRALGDAQRFGDPRAAPALLVQVEAAQPTALLPIVRWGGSCRFASSRYHAGVGDGGRGEGGCSRHARAIGRSPVLV